MFIPSFFFYSVVPFFIPSFILSSFPSFLSYIPSFLSDSIVTRTMKKALPSFVSCFLPLFSHLFLYPFSLLPPVLFILFHKRVSHHQHHHHVHVHQHYHHPPPPPSYLHHRHCCYYHNTRMFYSINPKEPPSSSLSHRR